MHRRPCLLHLQHLLTPVLLLLLLSASSTGASVGHGEFTFDAFFGNDLTMDGEASVSDGLLRLTSGHNQLQGHAFYTYPLSYTRPKHSSVPSFSTTFVFTIIGPYLDSSAHGLAFVLSSTKELFSALPGQYLGLLNSWNDGNASNRLLAIELDTMQNNEFRDMNMLGYALAEYRMRNGSQSEDQTLALVYCVFVSSLMTLCMAPRVVWLVFFPSYSQERAHFVVFELSFLIWMILYFWAIVITRLLLHEALVSLDFMQRVFCFYLALSFPSVLCVLVRI